MVRSPQALDQCGLQHGKRQAESRVFSAASSHGSQACVDVWPVHVGNAAGSLKLPTLYSIYRFPAAALRGNLALPLIVGERGPCWVNKAWLKKHERTNIMFSNTGVHAGVGLCVVNSRHQSQSVTEKLEPISFCVCAVSSLLLSCVFKW